MKSRSSNIQPNLQAHCQSHTSQRYNQSFVKDLAKPTQGEFQNIFSSPSIHVSNETTDASRPYIPLWCLDHNCLPLILDAVDLTNATD